MMKTPMTPMTLMLATALLGAQVPATAQPPEVDLTRQREAIEALSFMFGEWHGESRMLRGPEAEVSQVVEKIAPRLDGTLLLIEGRGTETGDDGASRVVHDAVAVIWFDEIEDRYRMRTFIPGRTTEADFDPREDGVVWGFDTPGGRVRYTATFADDTWVERGEFSRDGETWMPLLEMRLQRVMGDGSDG